MLSGELVNRNSREEPVCLKHSEGLVAVNVGARPPVFEGRARQSEQLGSSS